MMHNINNRKVLQKYTRIIYRIHTEHKPIFYCYSIRFNYSSGNTEGIIPTSDTK